VQSFFKLHQADFATAFTPSGRLKLTDLDPVIGILPARTLQISREQG
jgi:hypothetical protein